MSTLSRRSVACSLSLLLVLWASLTIIDGGLARAQQAPEGHDHSAGASASSGDDDHGTSHDHGSGSETSAPHDHATGHGAPEGAARALRWIGKLHPLAVHFPIALILGALLA